MKLRLRLRVTTPRPLHVVIAAVLVAILVPTALLIVAWLVNAAQGYAVDSNEVGEVWVVALHIGGPGLIIGGPIAMLLRWLARHSIVANLTGFVLFAAIAPIYEIYAYPILQAWMFGAAVFAVYGAITVALALLIGWLRRHAVAPDVGNLADTFE
jgi:hypothetical protein